MSTPVSHCIKINIDCFSETRTKVGNGRCIKSDAVVAGGHSWRISFFPNGMVSRTTDAISLFLALEDDHDGKYFLYRVSFRFKLYEVSGGPPRFTSADLAGFFGKGAAWARGFERFATLKDLEESGVLKQDRFTIGCEFTIFSASIVSRPTMRTMPASGRRKPSVEVPSESSSSELHADLGRLLETMEGADVEFEVHGKVFAAHKIVLAARSSVFKDEFFGPTKAEETTIRRCIHINKMEPKTFEALLHYVYTDTLPEMEGKEDKAVLLARNLLDAADKYNLNGLKSIAEDQLCNNIDASGVFRMLATAEGYQCWKLKKMCLEFIGSTKNASAIMANEDVEILATCCPSDVKDVMPTFWTQGRRRHAILRSPT